MKYVAVVVGYIFASLASVEVRAQNGSCQPFVVTPLPTAQVIPRAANWGHHDGYTQVPVVNRSRPIAQTGWTVSSGYGEPADFAPRLEPYTGDPNQFRTLAPVGMAPSAPQLLPVNYQSLHRGHHAQGRPYLGSPYSPSPYAPSPYAPASHYGQPSYRPISSGGFPSTGMNGPAGYVVGQGLIGQPKLFVNGQPIRNLLRFITP